MIFSVVMNWFVYAKIVSTVTCHCDLSIDTLSIILSIDTNRLARLKFSLCKPRQPVILVNIIGKL